MQLQVDGQTWRWLRQQQQPQFVYMCLCVIQSSIFLLLQAAIKLSRIFILVTNIHSSLSLHLSPSFFFQSIRVKCEINVCIMYTEIRKYIYVCVSVYVCVDKQGKFSNAFLLLASVWSGNSWNSTHFYFYNFLCAAQGRAVYNCVCSCLCVCVAFITTITKET